jgi:hypothetical protein
VKRKILAISATAALVVFAALFGKVGTFKLCLTIPADSQIHEFLCVDHGFIPAQAEQGSTKLPSKP